MTLLQCSKCKSTDLVEVSLVPRIMRKDPETGELDDAFDEAYWEAETIIGYGCENSRCENWHGNFGIRYDQDTQEFEITQGPDWEALIA